METNITIQLSESGQVSIPPAIRDMLHWESGMESNMKITSFGLLIRPKQVKARKRRLEEFRGFFSHRGTPLSDEELCAPVAYMERK